MKRIVAIVSLLALPYATLYSAPGTRANAILQACKLGDKALAITLYANAMGSEDGNEAKKDVVENEKALAFQYKNTIKGDLKADAAPDVAFYTRLTASAKSADPKKAQAALLRETLLSERNKKLAADLSVNVTATE